MSDSTRRARHSRSPAAPRRDRQATERRILKALGRLLAKRGFAEVGVNAVAAAAGVDKVLIYRYFGGLPALLAAYGASVDFWPTVEEVLGEAGDAGVGARAPLDMVMAAMLGRFIDAMRQRPMTIEILAWETVSRNELTAALEERRERWGEAIERRLRERFEVEDFDVPALTIVFTAASQYLLVRAREIRVYGGIPLREQAGWNRLKAMFAATYAAVVPRILPRQ